MTDTKINSPQQFSWQVIRRVLARVLCIALALLPLHAQAEDATKPQTKPRLSRGQVLQMTLLTEMDSAHAHVGDDVSFQLERDLNVGDRVVLPQNSVLHGRVTHVVRAGKNCKMGEVSWKLLPVLGPDGQKKIKLEMISTALAHPGGQLAERVSLDRPGTGQPGGLVTLPWLAPIALTFLALQYVAEHAGDTCGHQDGADVTVFRGNYFYAAVSKDVALSER